MTIEITEAQRRQYDEQGYFLLEACIPTDLLTLLRDRCEAFIDIIHKQMDEAGSDTLGINHRNSRYFIHDCYNQDKSLGQFIFSPLMAEVCKATLGDDAYLFWNQYVVKSAEKGMKFAWHQDSGYVGYDHRPYLTCWCTLDDVNEENGTVYILPYDRAGTRKRVDHIKEEGSNDLVGYFGDDPGIPVIAPAGSIAVFSSVTFHRSGSNQSKKERRIFLAQYSAEPLLKQDGSGPWGGEVPFLKDNEIIWQPE